MSWQKCPVCNGEGSIEVSTENYETCSVCKGRKIIDSDTGQAPKKPRPTNQQKEAQERKQISAQDARNDGTGRGAEKMLPV